jgi:hypothetical protein
MYVIEAKAGEDDVVFVVDHLDKTGIRVPALLRVSAETLKGAESKIVVGQQAGLTLLPRGFVVTQLAGHGGDLIFQDSSAFLLGFNGGDATAPVTITFSVAGMAPEVKPLRLIGQLQGELISGFRDLDSDNDADPDLVERVAQGDLNGDGALDLLIASSADPQRRSYELLLLGQPGGFTPIFEPDATIYGAAPITQRRSRGSVIGPAMTSKLKK